MVLVSILERRSLQQDVFTRNVSSLAALVVLVWEYLNGVRDERQFIWRGPFNRVKAIYFFSRYFGLCSQIANLVMVFNPLSEVPVPRETCTFWFIYLAVCSCSLLAAVDIALVLRVHVLYNRSWRVGSFLFFLVALQGGLVTKCTAQTIGVVPFDGICDVQETPIQVVYFMTSAMVTQITLLLMTIAKRKVAFGQSPVIELVVRDGTWVFVLIFAMVGTAIPYSLFVQVSKPHIVMVWPITFLSLACCRLILNMQKVGLRLDDEIGTGRGHESTGIAFTSIIDNSDTPNTSDTDSPNTSDTHVNQSNIPGL